MAKRMEVMRLLAFEKWRANGNEAEPVLDRTMVSVMRLADDT